MGLQSSGLHAADSEGNSGGKKSCVYVEMASSPRPSHGLCIERPWPSSRTQMYLELINQGRRHHRNWGTNPSLLG